MAWDEPRVSVGGLLGLGKGRKNSLRIIPEYGEGIKKKRKEM